jgi:hypothetical protein
MQLSPAPPISSPSSPVYSTLPSAMHPRYHTSE